VLDHHSARSRHFLARIAVCVAILFCPFFGVVGPLAASLFTYFVVHSSGPATLLVPVSVGSLAGALSGWAVNGWRRFGAWTAVAVAVGIVVAGPLIGRQDAEGVGAVAWAAVLLPTLTAVGVLVRRGARAAGTVVGVVGGVLAVEVGVTSLLWWLSRGRSTDGQPLWLWFVHARDLFQSGPFGAVGFTPHWLIGGVGFAVCLVLVTQRVDIVDPLRCSD